MNKRNVWWAVAVVLAGGCTAIAGLDNEYVIDVSSSSSSSSTGGADAGVECTTRDGCPLDTECTTYDCEAGQCAPAFKPDGTLLTGGSAGDCKKLACKGGKKADVPDDMDVPMDNDPCIVEECAAGILQSSKAADGTPCGAMGKLACVDGLCQGCNQDKNNCPVPPDCKEYDCPVNVCIETILEGKALDDPLQDDCKALFCDGMGMPVEGPDNMDLPVDTDPEDCMAPTCMNGMPGMDVVVPQGTNCGPSGQQKCCGMNCCSNTGDYCDMNNMCCLSGQVCAGTCCSTDHDCNGNSCCPMQQRCAGKTCCPNGMKCDMGDCVPV